MIIVNLILTYSPCLKAGGVCQGISYEYQDSDSTTANKWLANVTFNSKK